MPLENIRTYLMLNNITHVLMYVRNPTYVHIFYLPFIDGVATLGVGIGGGHGPEVIVP